jgi:hypothetical protein
LTPLRLPARASQPRPAKSAGVIAEVDGSGTAGDVPSRSVKAMRAATAAAAETGGD